MFIFLEELTFVQTVHDTKNPINTHSLFLLIHVCMYEYMYMDIYIITFGFILITLSNIYVYQSCILHPAEEILLTEKEDFLQTSKGQSLL